MVAHVLQYKCITIVKKTRESQVLAARFDRRDGIRIARLSLKTLVCER